MVLGGGFGGLGAARRLRKAPVEVLLVDRHDYHTFQPMLYQVATDVLDPETVAHPIREHFHEQANLRFVTANVTDIDLEARTVSFGDWDDQHYDRLVVALGAHVNYFGTEGRPSMPSRCTRSTMPSGSRTTCWSSSRRRPGRPAPRPRGSWTPSWWVAGRPASRPPAARPAVLRHDGRGCAPPVDDRRQGHLGRPR